MKNILFIITLFVSTYIYPAEVFFTPSTQCEDHIISEITNATKSVDVAVFAITNEKIVTALIAAHKKGTKIRILTDSIQAKVKASKIPELVNAGLELRIHSVNKIMHNKVAVFDEKSAINGSYNWTTSATEQNSENCVVFGEKEANIVALYHGEFERLWRVNTSEKSRMMIDLLMEKRGGAKASVLPIKQ
jgi:phosphatidylserine/phosphatidylglycerophosphate/cardiolipin synthase-like enzyme